MDKLNIVGCLTPNYLPKAVDWLDTVNRMHSCNVYLVLVGDWKYNDIADITNRYGADNVCINTLTLPLTHSYLMIQGGEFLEASSLKHLKDDALICLTDMDIFFQRDFVEEELNVFNQYTNDTIGVYYNDGNKDTLKAEAARIECDREWLELSCGKEIFNTCMNCGVMIGTISTFKQVYQMYTSLRDDFYTNCPHRSRIQFLVNWCWTKLGLEVKVLPAQIHQHGHFGFPKDVQVIDGSYVVDGKEVVMVHKIRRLKA